MMLPQVTNLRRRVEYLNAGLPGQFWLAAGRDIFGHVVEGPPDLIVLVRPVRSPDVVRCATQQQRVGFLDVRNYLLAGLRIPVWALPAGVL